MYYPNINLIYGTKQPLANENIQYNTPNIILICKTFLSTVLKLVQMTFLLPKIWYKWHFFNLKNCINLCNRVVGYFKKLIAAM